MAQVGDCVCVMLTCGSCHTLGLRSLPEQDGLFFPIRKQTDDCRTEARHLLSSVCDGKDLFTPPLAFSEYSAMVDKSGVFYRRMMFESHLKKGVCCKNIKSLTWIKLAKMINSIDSLWGPEPVIMSALKMMSGSRAGPRRPHEVFPRLIENRLTNSIQDFLPKPAAKGQKADPKRILAAAVRFTKETLKNLFQEFYTHAFPSQYWTLMSFKSYAKLAGWPFVKEEDIARLYRSFLPYGQLYLTFADFVMGVASMLPVALHGGQTGFQRMVRIFRFYDDSREQMLYYQNMYNMRRDILKSKKLPAERDAVKKALIDDYAALKVTVVGSAENTPGIRPQQLLDSLMTSINQKGLRGFSSLYRMHYDVKAKRVYSGKRMLENFRCNRHKHAHTGFAVHTTVITRSGRVKDHKLAEVERVLAPVSAAEKARSRQVVSNTHISQRILKLVHELADRIRGANRETNPSTLR